MIVFVNGKFVPEEQALVSVFDRSFLYGDGLFETMLVANGKPFRFDQHLRRLQNGAEFLSIRLPFAPAALHEFAAQLIERNQLRDGILRLTLSRGVGLRGYSPHGAERPFLTMTLHPGPPHDPPRPLRWRLATSSFRLPSGNPLARFKTNSKLLQISARAEAEAKGADEALLLNTDGHVIEAAGSNLFWIANGTVYTPPLDSGVLPGVTRSVLFEVCVQLGFSTRETNISLEKLRRQDGIFLSLTTLGVIEVTTLDGGVLARSGLLPAIRDAYWALVWRETA